MKKEILSKQKANGIKPDVRQSFPPSTDFIKGEFKEAERELLALDESGESLSATRVYEILEWFRDEMIQRNKDSKSFYKRLYKHLKHGDREHQKWLKNKINEFEGGNVA